MSEETIAENIAGSDPENTYGDTNDDANAATNPSANGDASVADRFERAIRGLQKPKAGPGRRPLQGITIQAKKLRLLTVEQCVYLGMSFEQMLDFLPTWGLPLGRAQLHEYLAEIKLPRY